MIHGLIVLQAADVQSTWDGSTNVWTSPLNWNHSAPSLLGYPSNGVQTYDVRVDSGEITLGGTNTIDRLELNGGTLTVQKLIALSNVTWTGGSITNEYWSLLEARGNLLISGNSTKSAIGLQTFGQTLVDSSVPVWIQNWGNYGALEFRGPGALVGSWPTFGQIYSYGNIEKTGIGEFTLDGVGLSSQRALHVREGTLRFRGKRESYFSGPLFVDAGATLEIYNSLLAETNVVIGGPGLIKIVSEAWNSPAGALGTSQYSTNPRFILLSNAHVELTLFSFLWKVRIDSNSVVTLTGTNFDGFGFAQGTLLDGTNFGKIFAKGSAVSLNLENQNLLEIQTNGILFGVLNNHGLVAKTDGTVTRLGSGLEGLRLFNSGTFDTRVGTMEFEMNGGTNVGTFLAASGASNIFSRGSGGQYFTFDTGTRFLGEGQHYLGFVAVSGVVTNFSNVDIEGPRGAGTFVNQSNGVITLNSSLVTIINQGLAIVDLENPYGQAFAYASSFTNRGIFEWKRSGFTGTIHNDAEIVKTSPANFIVGVETTLINRGKISIQEGTAVFRNAFTNTATMSVSSNAVLMVEGNLVLGAGTELQGDGDIVVTNGGNLIIAAPVNVPFNLKISGGTLTLLADCTIGGQVTLNGGTISGAADLIIASNANAFILNGTTAGAGKLLVQNGGRLDVSQEWISSSSYSRRIENFGVLHLSGYVQAEGEILNRGIADSRGFLSGILTVINEGVWNVSSNATWTLGHFNYDVPFFRNRGSLRVAGQLNSTYDLFGLSTLFQEAGEITLLGGSLDAVWEIRGGKLTGNGTVSGKLTSFGEISPGPTFGKLTLARTFLSPGSSITFDIGGTNTAALDAVNTPEFWISNNVTFVIRLVNGFMPKLGDEFELMKGNWSGPLYGPYDFPNFVGLTLTNGLRLVPVMNQGLKILVVPQLQPGEKPVNVVRSANGHLRLTWPPSSIGSVIQTTTNLSTPWRSYRLADPSGVFDFYDLYKNDKEGYFRFVDLEVQP
jgi:hypothetical protein